MREQLTRSFGFLKTTAIGGLIFLLPLVVISTLLGYVYRIVLVLYEPLNKYLPFQDTLGLTLLFLLAIAVLLGFCFVFGLVARRAFVREFTQKIEKQLVMVFPKYAIYKHIVAGNLGGNEHAPTLKPITVQFESMIRIAYETGRTSRGLVVVYLPGSPDPWIGSVALVEPHRVMPLEVDFNETAAICERLGRDSTVLLSEVRQQGTSSS